MSMASVSIRRVSHSEILAAPNASELIAEYAAECSIPQIGRINPEADTYALLEQSGAMTFFGVYSGDTLAGFASVLTTVPPHYGGCMVATVESLFVALAHRAHGAGRALMDALELHASEACCAAILYSAPASSRFARLLAASDSYVHTNAVYCRSLA